MFYDIYGLTNYAVLSQHQSIKFLPGDRFEHVGHYTKHICIAIQQLVAELTPSSSKYDCSSACLSFAILVGSVSSSQASAQRDSFVGSIAEAVSAVAAIALADAIVSRISHIPGSVDTTDSVVSNIVVLTADLAATLAESFAVFPIKACIEESVLAI